MQRFVRRVRAERAVLLPDAHFVIETAAGEEAQDDYGGDGPMVRDPEMGTYRRMRLFVLTLGYSRKAARPVGPSPAVLADRSVFEGMPTLWCPPQPRGIPKKPCAVAPWPGAEALATGYLHFLGNVLTHSLRPGHIPTEAEVRSLRSIACQAQPLNGPAWRRQYEDD